KRIALSSRAFARGRTFLTRHAAPATCGEAIDVPLATRFASSLPYIAITVSTPLPVMSGKKRPMSPDSGPFDEKEAMTLLLSHAAAVMPLAVEELLAVENPSLAAAVTGSTLAFSAHASIACWLTSVGFGLDEYDMFATEMLCRTLSAATFCQAAA